MVQDLSPLYLAALPQGQTLSRVTEQKSAAEWAGINYWKVTDILLGSAPCQANHLIPTKEQVYVGHVGEYIAS